MLLIFTLSPATARRALPFMPVTLNTLRLFFATDFQSFAMPRDDALMLLMPPHHSLHMHFDAVCCYAMPRIAAMPRLRRYTPAWPY